MPNEPDNAHRTTVEATADDRTRRAITEDIFCPQCTYNLRGLTADRCPECGRDIADIHKGESQIPWVHRKKIGRIRAYWKTVWIVCFHPKRFGFEPRRSVDRQAARRFRQTTLVCADCRDRRNRGRRAARNRRRCAPARRPPHSPALRTHRRAPGFPRASAGPLRLEGQSESAGGSGRVEDRSLPSRKLTQNSRPNQIAGPVPPATGRNRAALAIIQRTPPGCESQSRASRRSPPSRGAVRFC